MQNMASPEVYGKNEPEYVKQEMAKMFKDFSKVVSGKG
jgi:hypothetical protein